jgi:hypothetical protein
LTVNINKVFCVPYRAHQKRLICARPVFLTSNHFEENNNSSNNNNSNSITTTITIINISSSNTKMEE